MTSNLNKSTMRSSNYYRANLEGDRSVYSPLEGIVVQSPPTPPSGSHKGRTSSGTPPEEDMVAHLKLPTFKGVGDEDIN